MNLKSQSAQPAALAQQENNMFKLPIDKIPTHIFRTYDIRGNTLKDLTADLAHDIGLALGSEALAHGAKNIIVARDGRLSGPHLFEALTEGLLKTGINILDIGVVPTPLLYFATNHLEFNTGVMLTGSHNPRDDNGLKTVLNGKTLSGDRIQDLLKRIQTRNAVSGVGVRSHYDHIIADYIKDVASRIKLARPLKIVVDAGNGVTGAVIPELYRAVGCEVTPLFCEVDGNFSNHHPDPAKPENLAVIIDTVAKQKADIGLAFDGDGDRLGVVTSRGEIIYPDRQLMLLARDLLERQPGSKIVFDVKCSKNLAAVIEAAGGIPIMSKTGHSILKQRMYDEKAPLAGEMSGHIFFCENWYGFDDGMYAGARVLEILAKGSATSSELFASVPDSISTPEINVNIADDAKYALIEKLQKNAKFPNAKIINIDGLRIEFPHAWGLVRASNTTPMLTLRFEADDEAALMEVKKIFREFLLSQSPDLKLDF
jgi:phosphomannomutase / phosphoglucomutase